MIGGGKPTQCSIRMGEWHEATLLWDALRSSTGRRRVNQRFGMTAIELLVACTLAALMIVTVSSIFASLSAQHKNLVADRGTSRWRQQLAEELHWDLGNARWFRAAPSELHLEGFCSRDFESGVPTQRPVAVVYQVRRNGRQSWLARTETHLDQNDSDNARTELVCVGVEGLVIEPLDGTARPADPARWDRVPGRLRVVLWGRDVKQPLLDRVFVFDPLASPSSR